MLYINKLKLMPYLSGQMLVGLTKLSNYVRCMDDQEVIIAEHACRKVKQIKKELVLKCGQMDSEPRESRLKLLKKTKALWTQSYRK